MNIHVDRPDKQGRKEILKVHLKNIKTEENLDIDILAGLISGMVGADLANLINEAALLAVRRGKMSKSELLNRMATLLGGRAAEEIVFEDISTGAHNDLARATDIARSMVKEYGMSAKVGQIYFAREKRNSSETPKATQE